MIEEPVVSSEDFEHLASRVAEVSAMTARLLGRVAGQGRSVTAWRVLSTIDREGAQRVGDLAVQERIAQPSMTALVGRLEKDDLLTRIADPDDGRATRAMITQTGHEVLEAYRARATAALSAALGMMTTEELRTLEAATHLFDRMIAALDSQIR